jgi:hypothetical protein
MQSNMILRMRCSLDSRRLLRRGRLGATPQVARGVPLDILSDNLGHSGLGTTSIYVLPERRRKMAAIERLWK